MVQRSAKGKLRLRCAIYTRKSSEEGLEQEFNSLDAQREACEALSHRNGMRDGLSLGIATTTPASRAARWSGLRFSGS